MPEILLATKTIDEYFEEQPPFFILSLGRSGSLFLADLLNQAQEITVLHEPTRLDFAANLISYYFPNWSAIYISRFRKRQIYSNIKRSNITRYGEVNSILRRQIIGIKHGFPSARLIYLIRDGRDAVRSMMARKTFTLRDPITSLVRPLPGDDYAKKWRKMDRFARICWYWQNENQQIFNRLGQPVRFEDLVSDYGKFRENILKPLDIEISKSIWEEKISRPKNITRKHVFPHWSDWDSSQTEKFNKICGKLMNKFGYTD